MDFLRLCQKYVVLRYLMKIKPNNIYHELTRFSPFIKYSRNCMDQLTHQIRHNLEKTQRLLDSNVSEYSFDAFQFNLKNSTENDDIKLIQFYTLVRAQLNENLNQILFEVNYLFYDLAPSINIITEWIVKYWKSGTDRFPLCLIDNSNYILHLMNSKSSLEKKLLENNELNLEIKKLKTKNENLKRLLNEKIQDISIISLDEMKRKRKLFKVYDDNQFEYQENNIIINEFQFKKHLKT